MIPGAIIIDKPLEWTSHDVVGKVRRLIGERSVGHLGTLDPMASGVLPLLIGSATRLARFYGKSDKVYEARVCFGYATDTYDAVGEPTSERCEVSLNRDAIEKALAPFRGVIQQMPPAYSAKKIGGVPAYKLARQNKPVDLKPVEIEVFSLDLLNLTGDEADLRVHCSTGTYVRSLAHDLGQRLGCGAHLSALRRTRSGEFRIEDAQRLSELSVDTARVIPATDLLPAIPSVVMDDVSVGQIRNGRDFRTSPFVIRGEAKFVKALTEMGTLLAIGEAVMPNVYHPAIVFA